MSDTVFRAGSPSLRQRARTLRASERRPPGQRADRAPLNCSPILVLHPTTAAGANVNFLIDEGVDRVRAAYRQIDDRLSRIKAVYDPGSPFHVNQNIPPSA